MKKITKIILSMALITILSFTIGILSGKGVLASDCGQEEETSAINKFAALFSNKVSAACQNDIYMGAKWITGYVKVDLTEVDSSTVKSRMRSAISHFNANQNHLDIVERAVDNPTGYTTGYIYVTDSSYAFESWTAKADGSWYGGWPVENYYEEEPPINIKFNTSLFFDGTYNQELATARHELGHSVGLGHTNNTYTLMYCSRAGRNVYGLTSNDKEVLNIIY